MSLEQIGKNTGDGCVVPGQHVEVSVSGGAARTLLASESGGTFSWDAATGVAYTLPAPVVGMEFDFYCTVAVTSNAHAVITDAGTTFLSGAINQIIDTSAVSEGQVGAATDVTISMNGTTTGGLIGTWIKVRCVTSTLWVAQGLVVSSGTLVTPFA
jgi:hypothetical protein